MTELITKRSSFPKHFHFKQRRPYGGRKNSVTKSSKKYFPCRNLSSDLSSIISRNPLLYSLTSLSVQSGSSPSSSR